MTEFSMPKVPSPSLWAKCLIGSLILHSAALYVLIEHPIALKNYTTSLFVKTKPASQEVLLQNSSMEKTLLDFFEEFPLNSMVKDKGPTFALTQTPSPLETSLDEPILLPPFALYLQPHFLQITQIKSL